MTMVVYDRNEPMFPQNDDWSCAPTSTRWALEALERKPAESWIEATMISEGVVSTAQGLLDATGAGLAAFVRRHYTEFGYDANHEPSIGWEWAVREGGEKPDGSGHLYPVLIGGRAWNHWSGLRDYDPARKVLLLANPAEGWKGVGQTMTKAQFDALGPFSAVRIWHRDLFAPPPGPPIPVPDPLRAVRAELIASADRYDAAVRDAGDRLRDEIRAIAERIGG
jgi:hypothetical protein